MPLTQRSTNDSKQDLRQRLRQKWQFPGKPRHLRAEMSRRVCGHLIRFDWLRDAHTLCAYSASFDDEPDLSLLLHWFLAQGRRVLLPRHCPVQQSYAMALVKDPGSDLQPGPYGILAPHPEIPAVEEGLSDTGTVWCVPAAAFDAAGNRLGRGGGWYDRLLLLAGPRKIGVTYEENILDAIPSESHDIRMDALATEESVRELPSTNVADDPGSAQRTGSPVSTPTKRTKE